MSFSGLDSDSSSPFADSFSMDHGKVHVINNSAAWDAKLAEATSTGKIVSILFVHFCISFVPNSQLSSIG